MTAAPLFTVVIPCFRARDSIATALSSVLAQSEPDFEVFLIDDGSPDDTVDMALEAAGGDRRVGLLRQDNRGPAAARNRGIHAGSGRFVAFLDADDRWAPDLLACHRDHFAANQRLGVSFARIRFYDPTLTRPGRVSAYVENLHLAQALGENPVCTTSNIAARRVVFAQAGDFDAAMTHAEDQEWLARVLATTDWRIGGIDAALVDYRTSAAGLSADLDRMLAGWRAMIERVRAHAPGEVARAEPAARALFERYLARRALRTGKPAALAFAHMLAAIRSSPAALLANEPRRTLLTVLGVLASLLPSPLVRAAVTR